MAGANVMANEEEKGENENERERERHTQTERERFGEIGKISLIVRENRTFASSLSSLSTPTLRQHVNISRLCGLLSSAQADL